jgi:SAM-dependent methyltransferase
MVRARLRRLLVGDGDSGAGMGSSGASILDEYVTSAPSGQSAVDVFAGEWSSRLPVEGVRAGEIPLFEDERVDWALEHLGGVAGRRVLELGPLEGGHSYMLERAGARVTAVEAQTRAYLKCLIVKELLGLERVRFLMGDFMEYLRGAGETFDVCFASGVLYHLRNPVEMLELVGKVASRLFLWTHVYDEDVVRACALLAPRFSGHEGATYAGFRHTLHRFNYESALRLKGFCGGSAQYSNWLSRDDLFAALGHCGWRVEAVGFDQPDHPHGPALAVVARREDAGAGAPAGDQQGGVR